MNQYELKERGSLIIIKNQIVILNQNIDTKWIYNK